MNRSEYGLGWPSRVQSSTTNRPRAACQPISAFSALRFPFLPAAAFAVALGKQRATLLVLTEGKFCRTVRAGQLVVVVVLERADGVVHVGRSATATLAICLEYVLELGDELEKILGRLASHFENDSSVAGFVLSFQVTSLRSDQERPVRDQNAAPASSQTFQPTAIGRKQDGMEMFPLSTARVIDLAA